MKRLFAILATLLLFNNIATSREVYDLNFSWKFHFGDINNAESVELNDSDWRIINVPHDFQIAHPSYPKQPNNISAGLVKSGIGWYRRQLNLRNEWKGKRLLLDFESIMYVGDVYLNGEHVGSTDYGYLGFEVDITDHVNWNGPNIIAVKANLQNPENSRWHTGGGLTRNVKLIVTNLTTYFERHPLQIITPNVSDKQATVIINAEISRPKSKEPIYVQTIVRNPEGKAVSKNTVSLKQIANTFEYRIDSISINNPELWDLDSPKLYTVESAIITKDSIIDIATSTFGIRSIEYGPEFGFKLNGKKVLLKGMANHHTLGALGAADYERANEKRIQTLKQFGVNHIRTSHNPYSETFLNLCDQYGILVVDELYDKWLTQYAGGRRDWNSLWQSNVSEFIKRDRNHPCVIMWSLGNENQLTPNLPFADWGVTPYKLMRTLVQRYDTTRPTTATMHPHGRNLNTDSLPSDLAYITDIQAYNYRFAYTNNDKRLFPWMNFYLSEANVAMIGQSFIDFEKEKNIGIAYWGLIDYLRETSHWPALKWGQGTFYINMEPKPSAYLLKSFFMPEEPTVHICISSITNNSRWTGEQISTTNILDHWNFQQGDSLNLWVISNADEMELILNGKSLGTKQNDRSISHKTNHTAWKKVPFEQGTLVAIARTNGKVVAYHKIETATAATHLFAQHDNNNWKADGYDLQHITISALDNQDRLNQTYRNQITFNVEGPAEIVAVTNGDIQSEEPYISNTRRLWNGETTVILRSKRQSGIVTLSATSPGLAPVKIVFQTSQP